MFTTGMRMAHWIEEGMGAKAKPVRRWELVAANLMILAIVAALVWVGVAR